MKATKLTSITLVMLAVFTTSAYAQEVRLDGGGTSKKDAHCYRGARKPAEVLDLANLPVATGSQKKLSAAQIKNVITSAALSRNWQISNVTDTSLDAALQVRNKHTIIVNIPYSANSYSLMYKDSINMNYAACDGARYIHPNYNVWVSQLKTAIDLQLNGL
ncbi:MAG: hypothetical protein LBV44_02195 [Methylobacillus sp.]|jgi:hypothetical protein|nr:hypothetical protein [Methylobacillus sp.]